MTELIASVLPQFFPVHWLQTAPDIAHTNFPSSVRVGYVIRGDGGCYYSMHADMAAAGVSLDALHQAALHNLGRLPLPQLVVGKTPGGPEAFLDSQDDFTAVRLLLPTIREAIASELGDEHYAAIPCRDWFICCSKNQSPERQQDNFARARAAYLEDAHKLTPDVLFVSDAGFSLYLEQET